MADSALADEMLSHLRPDIPCDEDQASQVAAAYAGRSVFITGATGFLGKALVEKLARSCSGVKRIYLLIREKRGKDVKERLAELTESRIFERVKAQPDGAERLKSKLRAIQGDITAPKFGISPEDMAELSREVSVVFNSAATIRFVEPIEVAVRNNIYSVGQLVEFCDQLANLRALVHLSTAYSNTHIKQDTIREIFYEPPMRGAHIIEYVRQMRQLEDRVESELVDVVKGVAKPASNEDGVLLSSFTELALKRSNRPNTYCLTKAISEYYLLELVSARPERYIGDKAQVRVSVLRPSIVGGAWREPIVGFVDNLNGPAGAIMSHYTGVLQAMPGGGHNRADLVPVDMVIHHTLACGWFLLEGIDREQVAENRSRRELSIVPDKGVYLFNFVSGFRNPVYWRQVTEMINELAYKYPAMVQRLPKAGFVQPGHLYHIYDLINHRLPAHLMDWWRQHVQRRELSRRTSAVLTYERIRDHCITYTPFTNNQWLLSDTNTELLWSRLGSNDQRLFPFDIRQVDWTSYLRNYILGVRVYLIRDSTPMTVAMEGLRARLAAYRISLAMMALAFYSFVLCDGAIERALAGLIGRLLGLE